MDSLKYLQAKYPSKQFALDEYGRIEFYDESTGCMINDPTRSCCGRFDVHPTHTYGISWLSAMVIVTHNRAIELPEGAL